MYRVSTPQSKPQTKKVKEVRKRGGVGRPRKWLQQAGMDQGERKQLARDQSFSETVKLSKNHRRNSECEYFQSLIFWGAFFFTDFDFMHIPR